MITLNNFEVYVPYKIWQRGEEYYESGAVIDLQEISDEDWIATVQGTDDYAVEVLIENDIIASWNCDCPYEGEICKHVVATILAIRNHNEKVFQSAFSGRMKQTDRVEDAVIEEEIPHQTSSNEELESLLSFLDHEELSQLVLEYASKSSAFSDFLKQRMQSNVQSETEKNFQVEVCMVFNSYTSSSRSRYRRYDEPEHDWATILNKVDSFLSKAKILIKGGNYDGAISIALQVLRSIGEEYDDDLLYNDSVDVSSLCEEAGELIVDLVKNHTLSQEQKDDILKRLCQIAEISTYKDYGIFDVNDLVQDIMLWTEPVEKALALIDNLLEDRKESRQLFEMVFRKVDLLQRMGEQQKADKTMARYLYLPEVREREIERLMGLKKYSKALTLLDEGIRIEANEYSTNKWNEKKLEIYEKVDNKAAVIDVCQQLFISTHGDLQYYKKLKELIPEIEWKKYLKSMMEKTKFCDSFSFSGSTKADIYVCERDNDSLFHMLESADYNQQTALLQYATYLRETHSKPLLAVFNSQLKKYAESNVGRNHYEYIAKALKMMQKLKGGDEAVKQLVAEFRMVYKRRPAMMSELSAF